MLPESDGRLEQDAHSATRIAGGHSRRRTSEIQRTHSVLRARSGAIASTRSTSTTRSYHTGSNARRRSNTYWDLYGASGIAEIYKETKDADRGGRQQRAAYLSTSTACCRQQGGDYYANWYTRHIESIQNAGKAALRRQKCGRAESDSSTMHGTGNQQSRPRDLRDDAEPRRAGVAHGADGMGRHGHRQRHQRSERRHHSRRDDAAGVWHAGNDRHHALESAEYAGTFAPVGTLYDNNWTIRDTASAGRV